MKALKTISIVALAVLSGCGFPHNSAERPPAPYTPLKVEVSGETMSVSVWNRTYRYKNSVFPVSVETAGREIFAAPMSLHAKFGDKEGEFHGWQYTLLRADARSAQVLVAAHCENVMVNAALTFAYDGFVKTDLKVVPYGYHSLHVWVRDYDPTLAELWFDVDLKKESSTLLHFWPSADSAQTWAPEIRNSAETRPQDLPFKPYVWCGWEDGGFGISCESNEAFELADARKCISVAQEGGRTRLRYRLLDHMPKAWKGRRDRWEDALLPVCWSFGLQATPVKPRPAGDPDVYRRLHIYEVDKANILTSDIAERFGKAGVRYVVLHSTFSRAEGYGIIGDPKEFQAIVDRFHENGVKVLVYYGYEYPTIMPDWNEKWRDYLIRSPSGGAEGGWQAETHRAYQSCYNSGWARDVEENVYDIVDRYGLDGIYTDGMYIPWECANERHGCGWRDADGKLHVTYPIAAVRDLAERLYEGLHARGGTIDVHQSACMVSPVLSFADSCFDGEHVQQSLADNLESVSTESFRCEYSGYAFGIPMSFIAYTNEKLKIGMLAAMTLVHNVHPVPRELGDLDYVANIWKIYEELDLDERTFEPYWSNGIKTPKGVYASVYRDGGKVTYVVSNLTLKRKRVSLPACGRAAAKDLVTGKSYPAAGGAIELELEPFTPYLLDCTGAGRSSEPVASAAPRGAEFENGFVRLAFDEKGRVASIREKKSGRELIAERHAFVTVATRDGRVLEPVSLERRGDGTLSFGFPGGGSCELAFSPFDGGWTIETRSFSVPDAELLKFARVLPACNARKGSMSNIVEDDDSAVVVRAYTPDLEMNETNWRGMNESVCADRETYCGVKAEFGFVGKRCGLSAGPRAEMLAMLKGMAEASGLVVNRAAGPWSLESEVNRTSYLFATWMDYESLDDWIRLLDKAGCQMLHFHAWWKTRGHYEPDVPCFPGGLEQMREAVARVHAAGKKASTHSLAAAVQFGDPWIAPEWFDDYVYNAHYTLARPFREGDDALYVNERPIERHARILTGHTEGNILRIGDDLVQYADFSREKPYRFTGIYVARQPYGDEETFDNTQAMGMSLGDIGGKKGRVRRLSRAVYPAGTPVGYIHQRCAEFLPRPGTRLAREAMGVVSNFYHYCGFDGIYLDGAEIWGSRYNIDKMRYDTMAMLCASGSSVFNASSCRNPFDWWMRSIVGSWDHPVHGPRAFQDRHIRVHVEHCAADYNQVDLGWWNTHAASEKGRGYFPEEMEYFGCKAAAHDMTTSIIGARVTDGPLVFAMDDQLTISGWWSNARYARAFKTGLQKRMQKPGEDWRMRQDESGLWTVRPVAADVHRVASPDFARWTVRAGGEMPAELRVEALYGADQSDGVRRIRLLDSSMLGDVKVVSNKGVSAACSAGSDPKVGGTLRLTATNADAAENASWAGFHRKLPVNTFIEVNPVSTLWVKGDGSGAYLNVQICRAPEFSTAFSENFVRLDFRGWRRVDLLLRERDADISDRFDWPYENRDRLNTPSLIFRNTIGGKTSNEFSYWLNGIPKGGKVDIEVGAWDSIAQTAPVLPKGAVVRVNGSDFAVPFELASGEWAELKGGAWWHYAENGEPLGRIAAAAEVRLLEGDNSLSFSPAAGAPFRRAEVTVLGLCRAEPAFGPLSEGQRRLMKVEYELPQVLKPSAGLVGPYAVRVRPGESASLGFEILGPVKDPVVMGRRIGVELADAQERLRCDDGRTWTAERVVPGKAGPENRVTSARREKIAEGAFAEPLPVLGGGTTKVDVSAASADGARVTFFKTYR